MDAKTAYWLQDIFEGAQITPILGCKLPPPKKTGRPKQYANDAERARAYRERIKQKAADQLQEVKDINGWGLDDTQKPIVNQIPVFKSIYDAQASAVISFETQDEFIKSLKSAFNGTIARKHQNILVSSAMFDPTLNNGDTKRGAANIEYLNGIWLDNDGGDLTHQGFTEIFADLRLVITSTYSSTAAKPRWRCYIPTSDAMGPETHAMIIANIVQRLSNEGYYGKVLCQTYPNKKYHGFDESKFTPSSIFYAPSQSEVASNSFFKDYKGKGRKILDIQEWILGNTISVAFDDETYNAIEDIPTDEQEAALANLLPSVVQTRIESAITDWRNTPHHEGFAAFAKLFGRLKAYGMSYHDLQETMTKESIYGNSPDERRREVKNLMRYYNR